MFTALLQWHTLKHGQGDIYAPQFRRNGKRITNLSTRGIVLEHGETLLDMYNERFPLYEKYADFVIDCDGNTIDDTVAEIVDVCEK